MKRLAKMMGIGGAVVLQTVVCMAEGNGLWGCRQDLNSEAFFKGVSPSDTVTVQVLQRNLDLGVVDGNPPSDLMDLPSWILETSMENAFGEVGRGLSMGAAVHYQIVVKKGKQVIDNFGFFKDEGGTWRCDTSAKNQIFYDAKPVYEATTSYKDVYETKQEIIPEPRNYSIARWEQCQTGAEAFVSRLNQKESTQVKKEFQPPAVVSGVRATMSAAETVVAPVVDPVTDWAYRKTHDGVASSRSVPETASVGENVSKAMGASNDASSDGSGLPPGMSAAGMDASAASPPAQAYETIDYRPVKNWASSTINDAYSQATGIADSEGFGAEYRSMVSPIVNQSLNYIQSIPDQVQVPAGQ